MAWLRGNEVAGSALDMLAALGVLGAEPVLLRLLCFMLVRPSSYVPLLVAAFCAGVFYIGICSYAGVIRGQWAAVLWVASYVGLLAFARYRQRSRIMTGPCPS
jgi:hypothetical protein